MILRRMHVFSGLLLFAAAAPAYADPTADWQSGQQAYAAGDYASALLYFEIARDQGLAGAAVHYNVAVCRYRLEQWSAARDEFRYIATHFPNMRGLAEYNLGLVARSTGDTDTARHHFLAAYEQSPEDEKLRILASNALGDLPAPRPVAPPSWTGMLGLRAGHDSNVALRDDLGLPAGQTAESPMTDLFASFQGPWRPGGGFRAEGSAYVIRYFDAGEFDQSALQLGAVYDWRPSTWRVEFGADWGFTTLDGEEFERTVGTRLRLARPLSNGGRIELRYRYDDVDGVDPAFAGIAGTRQRAELRYRWIVGDTYFALRYGLEKNDRIDAGVSPDRQRVTLDIRYQPEFGWGFEAGGEFRASDYADLETPRQEDLASASAAVTYALPRNWLALLQLRYTENDSSDPVFSYDRMEVTLGAYKLF